MAELTPKTINELPEASTLSDSDLFPLSSGGAAKKTLWSTIKTKIGMFFGGVANKMLFTHYGQDNGVEARWYGTDSTVYSVGFYSNSVALNKSDNGGNSFTQKWIIKPIKLHHKLYASATTDATGNVVLGAAFKSKPIVNVEVSGNLVVWSVGVGSTADDIMIHFTTYAGAVLANTPIVFRVYWVEPSDFTLVEH